MPPRPTCFSFSEAIANESRHPGVTGRVSVRARRTPASPSAPGTENSRLFKQIGAMSAEKVARDGYRAPMEGRTVGICGAHNWLVAESVRFAPRKVVTAISRWIAEKVHS